MGGYANRGFVEVLAASQTPGSQKWFQGTADAVRHCLWLFEESTRSGVEDYLILSGKITPPHLSASSYDGLRYNSLDISVGGLIAIVIANQPCSVLSIYGFQVWYENLYAGQPSNRLSSYSLHSSTSRCPYSHPNLAEMI